MRMELRNSLRFSASSLGSLFCSLRAASKLVSQKARLTQTSMPLVLSFAETSCSSESIFAQGIPQLPRRRVDGATGFQSRPAQMFKKKIGKIRSCVVR